MPVGLDPQYKKKILIIQKLANQYEINVEMPLIEKKSVGFDFAELMIKFHQADFIVADLSYERPSCYYELGIAEALRKEIQLIANSGTYIHQTSHKSDIYFYSNINEYEDFLNDLMRRLTKKITNTKHA